jgi:hypothetical protein
MSSSFQQLERVMQKIKQRRYRANPINSAGGGTLWWHPEASDLEVNFTNAGPP